MRPLRTVLFVPGDRPDRVVKAAAAGADAIAIDLEDAVAATNKAVARQSVVDVLPQLASDTYVIVRVNAVSSGLLDDDLEALATVLDRVDAVILPMCDGPGDVNQLSDRLAAREAEAGLTSGAVRVIPLIETAQGVLSSADIATASARIITLAFGPADLSRQLGTTPTAEGGELAAARQLVVLAAAAAGLARPVDGPYLDLQDTAGLERSTAEARRLGFGGKQVIHPGQIEFVKRILRPTDAELDWARRVVAAFSSAERSGVSSIRLEDGTFIDYPIARRAEDLLAEAT